MGVSNAVLGYGTTLSIDDGTGTFDLIAEVTNIDPPDQQSDEIEVTHMGSPDGYKEFIGGLKDPGEMPFDINWIPNDAIDVILRNLHASGVKRDMKITWPNLGTMNLNGFIKGFKRKAPINDKMAASISVRVSGAPTFT